MMGDGLEVSCEEARDLLSGDDPPVLIDCRELGEYDFCRIDGAILVPLSDFRGRAEEVLGDVGRSAIIYCHHGVRSLDATRYLHGEGFREVVSMRGGIDVWSCEVDVGVPRY